MAVVRKPVYVNENGIDLNNFELEILSKRGYEILGKLGEGNTRSAYLANAGKGDASRLVVVKPVKKELDPFSVCTRINATKTGDGLNGLNQREVVISNKLQHPYISETIDSFDLNGRRTNVEPYNHGTDLESLVKQSGPLSEKKFGQLASQMVEAIGYLHGESIIHRDIKPSNVVVTSKGNVKVTDLQTAAHVFNIKESTMPTRGGTPYTDPRLINALAKNERNGASYSTDIYSLGATFFYMLTGENAFDYSLVYDENGEEVQIGEETFRVGIKTSSDGKSLESISLEDHEKVLKERIKKVPKKYRNLVYRCLTKDHKKRITDARELKEKLDDIDSSFYDNLKDAVARGVKVAIPTLVGGTIAGLVALGITYGSINTKDNLTPLNMLMRDDYRDFTLDSLNDAEEKRMYWILGEKAEKVVEKLNALDEDTQDEIPYFINFAESVHGMDRRLVSAVLRAGYINKGQEELYTLNKKSKRLYPIFVPETFAQKFLSELRSPESPLTSEDAGPIVASGVKYLKLCLGPEKDVSDVLTEYYSSNEEINSARVKTNSINYLPREGENGIQEGYRSQLPLYQRELVDNALAFYLISDNNGEINIDKLNKFKEYVNLNPIGIR